MKLLEFEKRYGDEEACKEYFKSLCMKNWRCMLKM